MNDILLEPIRVTLNGIKRKGTKIGNHFFILPYQFGGRNYIIYKVHDKKPLGNTVLDRSSAIELCKKYEKIYFGYFVLWQAFPGMVLHEVCQYTVPNGQEWCTYFQERL